MFSTFITVALFVSLAIQGASANFAISTPTLDQVRFSLFTPLAAFLTQYVSVPPQKSHGRLAPSLTRLKLSQMMIHVDPPCL